MIKVRAPENNKPEREYIIHVLFEEFLGVEYQLSYGSKDWELISKDGKIFTIKDTFFNLHPKCGSYLNYNNIPKSIHDLDIFAKSFYMLSRWEEVVTPDRDAHGRFPAECSLAYREGFLHVPIVNEVVEQLKQILYKLDGKILFKKHEYKFLLSHDVDLPLRFYNLRSSLRSLLSALIKRFDIRELLNYLNCRSDFRKDPYFTFPYILKVNQKYGIKSIFHFMSGGITKFDNFYSLNDIHIKYLINIIRLQKSEIAFHPSYETMKNEKQLHLEYSHLRDFLGCDVRYARQHYLRFSVPETWSELEKLNIRYDCSLSYPSIPGFRCGVCYEFTPFDVVNRKMVYIKELPLIVMECSLFEERYLNFTYSESFEYIKNLVDEVKKYNGVFSILWHNDRLISEDQRNLYEQVLDYAVEHKS